MRSKWLFVSSLVGLLLVGFIATSLISYHVANDSIVRHLEEQMLPLTSDNIYSEIQRDLLQPVVISSLMANDTFVHEWALAGEQDPQRMAAYLAHISQTYDTITSFYVSEQTRQYYHASGILKEVSEDDPADAWYFRSRAIRDDYEINVDRDTAEPSRLSVFVNYRVLDETGRLIGVTGIGLSMDIVAALIESYQHRYSREIFFVDRQGEITVHGNNFDRDLHLSNQDGLNRVHTRILTSPSSSLSYKTSEGNTVYLNSRLIPEFDWFLVVEQDNGPETERLEGVLLVNVLISIGISLVVLLTAYFTVGGYQRRLEKMATRDKLTNAASRHVFDDIFWRANKRCQRKGTSLCLIAIDIDKFKAINDRFGHQYGDRVIQTIANIIDSQIRDGDVLCRWGGEEFLVLLEACSLERTTDIAEKTRHIVANHSFHLANKVHHFTISLGVAEQLPEETQDGLLHRCDEALYQSKRAGRNRCTVAESLTESEDKPPDHPPEKPPRPLPIPS